MVPGYFAKKIEVRLALERVAAGVRQVLVRKRDEETTLLRLIWPARWLPRRRPFQASAG